MNKPIVVFDADEVIFPTMNMVNGVIKDSFGITMHPGDWRTYNARCNPKIRHVADKLFKILLNGNYFAELRPIFGAIYGLKRIHEKYRIIISSSRNSDLKEQTVYSFENSTLPFDDIICGENKIEVVKRVRPVYFVDDVLCEHFNVLPYREINKKFKQIINTREWNDFYFDKRFLRACDWVGKNNGYKTIPEWLVKEGPWY